MSDRKVEVPTVHLKFGQQPEAQALLKMLTVQSRFVVRNVPLIVTCIALLVWEFSFSCKTVRIFTTKSSEQRDVRDPRAKALAKDVKPGGLRNLFSVTIAFRSRSSRLQSIFVRSCEAADAPILVLIHAAAGLKFERHFADLVEKERS
jgi:hypothetical protein